MYLHKEYSFESIENFSNEHSMELHELGIADTIGKNVIILSHPIRDVSLVFVMSSASGSIPYYELVYTDMSYKGLIVSGPQKGCEFTGKAIHTSNYNDWVLLVNSSGERHTVSDYHPKL